MMTAGEGQETGNPDIAMEGGKPKRVTALSVWQELQQTKASLSDLQDFVYAMKKLVPTLMVTSHAFNADDVAEARVALKEN